MAESRKGKKLPRGIRLQIVDRSCTHAIIRLKLKQHWHGGDWIYLCFEAKAQGNYLIKEAIRLTRQWQSTYKYGKAPLLLSPQHEFYAARLHAIKAIETMRSRFGDQGEFEL